jgi:hypothetical protein
MQTVDDDSFENNNDYNAASIRSTDFCLYGG